jgi:formylglycine-generating enzyme required for sulfatase activity
LLLGLLGCGGGVKQTPPELDAGGASGSAPTASDAGGASGSVEPKARPGMAFVPEGPFMMGSEGGKADEQPAHERLVGPFWIDLHEVSVEQYEACVEAKSCAPALPPGPSAPYYTSGAPGKAKHPINGVTWFQARSYCQWKGKRLPTEAEWEKAARGTDARLYPWGNEAPDCPRAVMEGCGQGVAWTQPVGEREAGKSPYGLYDMAGNLLEWVADLYQPDAYTFSGDTDSEAQGEKLGDRRVMRGGAFHHTGADLWVTRRQAAPPMQALGYVGFRCAQGPDAAPAPTDP